VRGTISGVKLVLKVILVGLHRNNMKVMLEKSKITEEVTK
jgi:hypothetical protein